MYATRPSAHTQGRSDLIGSDQLPNCGTLVLAKRAAGPTAGEMPDLCDELCFLGDTAAFEDFLACVDAKSFGRVSYRGKKRERGGDSKA